MKRYIQTATLRGGFVYSTTLHPYDQNGKIMAIKKAGLFGEEFKHRAKDILSSRFSIPPFSVLNTREGWWQSRKREWTAIGIKSELGRGYTEEGTAYGSSLGKSGELNKKYRDASPGGSPKPEMKQAGHIPGSKLVRGDSHGRPLKHFFPAMKEHGQSYGNNTLIVRGGANSNTKKILLKNTASSMNDGSLNNIDTYRDTGAAGNDPIGGTSIFDPTLCELIYRWFCVPGGRVLDPFAGGSVRGIVAGELGLNYVGIDLSERQINANREQAKQIKTEPTPLWMVGDSTNVTKIATGKFDLLFSCPPYGDLERYSDDPRDLSTLSIAEFRHKYHTIIEKCCSMLKEDSFACFIVGDYRDKNGYYANLPGQTVAAFERAGFHLYNWAILVNVTGSLPLRVNTMFTGSRKLGKTHQDVLIFAKKDPKTFVKNWKPNFVDGK